MNAKNTSQILCYEVKKQQERFEKLYGTGDYAAAIAKNIKRMIWLISGFLCLCLSLLVFQIYNANLSKQGVIIDSEGHITSFLRPNAGEETILMEANIFSESGEVLSDQALKLMITPLQTEKQQKSEEVKEMSENKVDTTQHEIRNAIYQLNSDTTDRKVTLPHELQDGTKIYWVPTESQNGWTILFVGFIGGYAIYHKRDARLIKAEKEARESILRELPEFVNKMILLLNAGLILSNAFNKIVIDYQRTGGGDNNYFYSQLAQISVKCHETNGSVQHEIRNFAIRTGVVEFMRLSNIINDSVTKGSDLVIQLKMEGDSLWAAKRKQLEEKGKIAETKLTIPLVILLLVLLMITIAPAMMEM
jgi:tight adherence protein C